MRTLLSVLLVVSSATLAAQTFEAVSIRPNPTGDFERGIDATGLSGEFDVDLYYQTGVSAGGDTGLDGSAPSLNAALQEQLGLRLESGQGLVEVVVIDAAVQPREQ